LYLKELTDISGVSGYEKKVREFIMEKIKEKVENIKEDNLGNLIAFKKGRERKKLMISAHMDEVGFMVSNIEEDGKISVIPLGSVDLRAVIGKKVIIGEREIPGIIGYKAIHLQRDDTLTPPSINDIKIDIGAQKKSEVEGRIKIGDFVAFAPNSMIHKEWFSGKGLDDRGGCSLLIDLINKDLNLAYDTYFVFSVQEELGLKGARISAERIMPDFAYVIETTTSGDNPEFSQDRRSTELGKGPVITPAHSGYVNDERLFNFAIKVARENNIPFQIKRRTVGGTDARAIALSSGAPSLVISIPSRYIHSPLCVMNLSDYENTLRLFSILLEKEVE
jgi:endoglucanase